MGENFALGTPVGAAPGRGGLNLGWVGDLTAATWGELGSVCGRGPARGGGVSAPLPTLKLPLGAVGLPAWEGPGLGDPTLAGNAGKGDAGRLLVGGGGQVIGPGLKDAEWPPLSGAPAGPPAMLSRASGRSGRTSGCRNDEDSAGDRLPE